MYDWFVVHMMIWDLYLLQLPKTALIYFPITTSKKKKN